jgi:HEAT repeat protein
VPDGKKQLSRAGRRQLVRGLLERRDLAELASLATEEPRVVRIVSTLILEPEDVIRWRAIEALGLIVSRKSRDDFRSARETLRRLYWSMNDESGNVPWHAPEAIGEILANTPVLIEEFGPMLSAFLREEPFERGTHWALARILWVEAGHLDDARDRLVHSLEDPDPFIRAHAALGIGAGGVPEHRDMIRALSRDRALLSIYDPLPGRMRQVSVADIAGSLIDPSSAPSDRKSRLYAGIPEA